VEVRQQTVDDLEAVALANEEVRHAVCAERRALFIGRRFERA
jgi:hypothetical protein